jgi:putative protease
VGRRKLRLGLTVYGALPLFRSRLNSRHFQFNKNLVSPKGEEFVLKKVDGMVVTVPVRPFSLLDYLPELKGMGLDYVVIDATSLRTGEKEMREVAERLSATGKYGKLPTFNYLGKLE